MQGEKQLQKSFFLTAMLTAVVAVVVAKGVPQQQGARTRQVSMITEKRGNQTPRRNFLQGVTDAPIRVCQQKLSVSPVATRN